MYVPIVDFFLFTRPRIYICVWKDWFLHTIEASKKSGTKAALGWSEIFMPYLLTLTSLFLFQFVLFRRKQTFLLLQLLQWYFRFHRNQPVFPR